VTADSVESHVIQLRPVKTSHSLYDSSNYCSSRWMVVRVTCRCFSWHLLRKFSHHSALPSVQRPQDTCLSPCPRYYTVCTFC